MLNKHKGFVSVALRHIFFNCNLIFIIRVVAINSFLPIGCHFDPDVYRARIMNTSNYANGSTNLFKFYGKFICIVVEDF